MRAGILLLLVLVCSALPATANENEAFRWPAGNSVILAPQLACVMTFDVAGSARCEVEGKLQRAASMTVRVQGGASAFAFADDLKTGLPRMLALADCGTSSCTKVFPETTTPHARLHVDASGPANSRAIVTLEEPPHDADDLRDLASCRPIVDCALDALLLG